VAGVVGRSEDLSMSYDKAEHPKVTSSPQRSIDWVLLAVPKLFQYRMRATINCRRLSFVDRPRLYAR